jgi:hypothetical protein
MQACLFDRVRYQRSDLVQSVERAVYRQADGFGWSCTQLYSRDLTGGGVNAGKATDGALTSSLPWVNNLTVALSLFRRTDTEATHLFHQCRAL